MKKLRVIVSFILLAMPTTLALAHSGATDIIKERMDMFKKKSGQFEGYSTPHWV